MPPRWASASSCGATAPAARRRLRPPASAASTAPGFATSEATDPYLWLEEVEGDRAMAWVKAHNGDPLNELVDQLAVAASLGYAR